MSVHEVTGSDDVWCHPHPQIRRSYGNWRRKRSSSSHRLAESKDDEWFATMTVLSSSWPATQTGSSCPMTTTETCRMRNQSGRNLLRNDSSCTASSMTSMLAHSYRGNGVFSLSHSFVSSAFHPRTRMAFLFLSVFLLSLFIAWSLVSSFFCSIL